MNLPSVRFRACLCSLLGFVVAASFVTSGKAEESGLSWIPAANPSLAPPAGSLQNVRSPALPTNGYHSFPGSDLEGFNPEPASQPWVMPIFYPPNPPVLGSPIPLPNPAGTSSQGVAPAPLAEYVNETFYAPLSTRLTGKGRQLNRHLQEKLDAYRVEKTALQNELRERLATLQGADPATRAQELATLAHAQASRIAQLEKTAEELRQELIRGDFFQASVDWNAIRAWRLGKSRFMSAGSAMAAQYQVMLAAAFYQNGLLPEQRGLLREIAMELVGVSRRGGADGADGVNPPLFFSPATARLRLPAGLPVELRDKIAAYEKEKSAIKQELRDTVYAQDKAFFSKTRDRAFAALAERQWPRLATLEEMAEEIRRDLARLPNPPGPPEQPPLPAALAARISAFLAEENEVQADILHKIEKIKKDFAIARVVNSPNSGSGGGGDLRLMISPGEQTEDQIKALQMVLKPFNQEIALRQSALSKEAEAIRREFEATALSHDGHSAESLLVDYAETLQEREEWLLYTDYQAAMLTPDLSPEQRRLLFDGAVEQLDLPLPGWDIKIIGVYD